MMTPTLGGWLVHVMREADGALSLEEALHAIMDSVKQYYPCQSVAVILIDDDTKELRIKISRQISYTFVKKFHRDGPTPTAERVVLVMRLGTGRILVLHQTMRIVVLEGDVVGRACSINIDSDEVAVRIVGAPTIERRVRILIERRTARRIQRIRIHLRLVRRH